MNITDANRLIAGLNKLAEGASLLAATIEDSAWESFEDHAGLLGTRPIAAVRLDDPSLTAEAEQVADTPSQKTGSNKPQPSPKLEPIPQKVSLEQVRGVLAELSQAGYTAQVRELIHASGAKRLSEVAPDKYDWLLAEAKSLGGHDG